MNARMIEHRGIVQHVEGGKAIVAMETAGRPATLLTLPASACLKAGDLVSIALPESRLTLSALLGYLSPAFAMMLGAWLGSLLDGSNAATALGAIAGFLAALAIARIVIGLVPGLLPAPQLIPLSSHSNLSQQEFHHERHNDH